MGPGQYQNLTPPTPAAPATGVYQKKSGEFGKAFKWGSGISLGCFGPGCAGLFLFFIMMAGLGASSAGISSEFVTEKNALRSGGKDKVAVIDIEGVIARDAEPTEKIEGYSSSSDINNLLDEVKNDKNIKAVVLSINSPGGYVSPTVDIYEKIKEVQKEGKKVVVSMGDTAASGGYYISAPADKIYAEKSTTTGSLGVIMTLMNLSGLFDKYGYKEVVVKSGEFKDMGSWSRDMTESERAIFQHFIDEAYDDFVKAIADGRGMTEADVRKAADGRIYTGTQAKELGLVDEIGGLWDAVAEAEKLSGLSDSSVIELSKQGSFKDEIIRNISKFSDMGFSLKKLEAANTPQFRYQWMP